MREPENAFYHRPASPQPKRIQRKDAKAQRNIFLTSRPCRLCGYKKIDPDYQKPNTFITNNSGKKFDPKIVSVFFDVLNDLKLSASGEKEVPISILREGMIVSKITKLTRKKIKNL